MERALGGMSAAMCVWVCVVGLRGVACGESFCAKCLCMPVTVSVGAVGVCLQGFPWVYGWIVCVSGGIAMPAEVDVSLGV